MKCSINLIGFERFDEGTKFTIGTLGGLNRGNIQYPGIVGLFGKS